MLLGCKPIFLAEKSQIYILFIDNFFSIESLLVPFLGHFLVKKEDGILVIMCNDSASVL